ncbi:hypothetical protein GCM10010954_16160 [Halobacillus andaensis]|uniref:Uncharacterized protein n=1 Tax=Halobacillus andaensis TaxID=1176239 RepID=A0A917B4H4_HALAA|nr:hypothetical protein [Halobacillus andaensis]MBP2004882.1 hypothetical protein [Halobacillus andaensis]GGF18171.1 hypothetical protein GCM10010954_16160 [Halobacillus andaensis]
MKDKLIAVLIANVLLGIIFYWMNYVPEAQRNDGTYYFGFGEIVTFVFIYAGPAYLLAGLPLSYIIEKYTVRFQGLSGYFLRLGLYAAAGLAVGLLYGVIAFQEIPLVVPGVFYFLGLGLLASLLFSHVLLVVTWLGERMNNVQKLSGGSNV